MTKRSRPSTSCRRRPGPDSTTVPGAARSEMAGVSSGQEWQGSPWVRNGRSVLGSGMAGVFLGQERQERPLVRNGTSVLRSGVPPGLMLLYPRRSCAFAFRRRLVCACAYCACCAPAPTAVCFACVCAWYEGALYCAYALVRAHVSVGHESYTCTGANSGKDPLRLSFAALFFRRFLTEESSDVSRSGCIFLRESRLAVCTSGKLGERSVHCKTCIRCVLISKCRESTGACAMAALNPVRPQKQKPAREEMLKLLPQMRSSFSVNGRHISSRQVDTRLMLVCESNPCVASTRVACLMSTSSGTALGKLCSKMSEYLKQHDSSTQ
jgi:hypothetical protein